MTGDRVAMIARVNWVLTGWRGAGLLALLC